MNTQNQNFTADTLRRAQELIARFRETHQNDVRTLDFITGSYLTGDGNKRLRQAVIFCIDGTVKPATKCTVFAVSDALKSTISQTQLF